MAADVNSTLDSFEGVLGGTEGVQREVVAEVRKGKDVFCVCFIIIEGTM